MRHFLITVAGVFAGLALFAVLVPVLVLIWLGAVLRPAPLADRVVLDLDLRGGLADQESVNPLAALGGERLSVLGIERALRRASSDSRVQGLIVRLPEAGMAPAAADELALAFHGFRAAGKPVLAYSQGFYQSGAVLATYRLATAAGEIWMQADAPFQASGLARGDLFFKRFFDKHGISADFQQRAQYKTAINPFLYSDYTTPHRESELSWMGSVYGAELAGAAADRRMSPTRLRSLIEAAPYSADQARAGGLIDRLGDWKAADAAMLARAGDGARRLDFTDYADRDGGDGEGPVGAPTIAVIAAEGAIMNGQGPTDPLSGEAVIHADDVADAFYRAIDDHEVKAIVFRLSSPGGSDTASEEILAAVRAARAAGKPVVVSMGTYGASGGYWVASQASAIVAEPTTLTGSIGVFGGKFVLGPALAAFGVDARSLKVGGDFADALDARAPMAPAQRAAFAAWTDRIYSGFIERVASGRRLAPERVRAIAAGRVWTGAQAASLGLVDQLGGFYQAVERARDLARLRGPARLEPFGAGPSALDALRRLLGGGLDGVRALAVVGAMARGPAIHAGLAEMDADRLRAEGATVLAPTPF